ncbi:hypothetical protein ASF48_05085 [Rathayibacter sp. Leaf299]|uniref:helix-turn-helix domain-containing protein n=1 Tax=Rathayibacter sp. Leaf299 TaxID=1736328 RepID=UPI0006FAA1D8|nr:helix-turn-helix domain-containing protein [Rathayibacter sp. Leaf299]KQQ22560.1 hypothetical protein ASF48_05085 [Rathayibacter sp. Leaf299]
MSVKVSSWVWHDHGGVQLNATELLVLIALADVADDNGRCVYYSSEAENSQAAWSEKCCVSVRTFIRTVRSLIDSELVSVTRQERTGTNDYRVLVPWAEETRSANLSPREVTSATEKTSDLSPRSSLTRRDVSKAPSKGSRMTSDWSPSTEDLDFLLTDGPSLDVTVEVASFRDYWLAVPGQKGIKLDWSATWRNHVRRQHRWNVERGWQPATTAPAKNWALL